MKPKLQVKKPDKPEKPEKQPLVINIEDNTTDEDSESYDEVVNEAFYVDPAPEESQPSILFKIRSGDGKGSFCCKGKTCCWILIAWTLVTSLAAVISVYYAIDAQNQLSEATSQLDLFSRSGMESNQNSKVRVFQLGRGTASGMSIGMDGLNDILKVVYGALQQASDAIADQMDAKDDETMMIQEAIQDFRGPVPIGKVKLPFKGETIEQMDREYAKEVAENEGNEEEPLKVNHKSYDGDFKEFEEVLLANCIFF